MPTVDTGSETPIIQARGLWKTFGLVQALRGVDLELRRGEFLTLFGPNGAGKTTLFKILSGLARPTSGAATVAGFDVSSGEALMRREIGVLSHLSFLYDHLTPLENMLFYARMYGLDRQKERALQVIEEVGLTARMHDRVGTFSRGMLQRLSIARAVLNNPSVLFLDEPYTGLDPHASNLFKERLHALHDKKRTIIMTTHDIQRGLEICDRVAILARGRIIFTSHISGIDRAHFESAYFERIAAAA